MTYRNVFMTVLWGVAAGTGFGGGELLLKSGFEPPVRITDDMSDIVGKDQGSELGWDDTPVWIRSSRFVYLVGRDKNLSDYMASFISEAVGPFSSPTHALCLQNIADDPVYTATSRNEFSFFGRKAPHDYQQGYVRYWMKLQADLLTRVPLHKPSPWYMIMEWKEPNSGIRLSTQECKARGQRAGGTNNYRINIGINREANSPTFHWIVRGEHPQPCRHTEWTYTNPDIAVPLGRWFLVEAYLKKHATQGRVYFTVNGQVVLDTKYTRPTGFIGRTQHTELWWDNLVVTQLAPKLGRR